MKKFAMAIDINDPNDDFQDIVYAVVNISDEKRAEILERRNSKLIQTTTWTSWSHTNCEEIIEVYSSDQMKNLVGDLIDNLFDGSIVDVTSVIKSTENAVKEVVSHCSQFVKKNEFCFEFNLDEYNETRIQTPYFNYGLLEQ